jgi:hypothetical protein
MKKNLLFAFFFSSAIITSCDERKTVETLTPNVLPATKSKTELLVRKWGFSESYFDVDAKKTIVYGAGAVANPNLETDITPNDYITFMKDGKVESYSDVDKKTSTGKWSFLNNETQVKFQLNDEELLMDINTLTEKDADISQKIVIANLANESEVAKGIVVVAAFGGLADEKSKIIKFGFKLKAK